MKDATGVPCLLKTLIFSFVPWNVISGHCLQQLLRTCQSTPVNELNTRFDYISGFRM